MRRRFLTPDRGGGGRRECRASRFAQPTRGGRVNSACSATRSHSCPWAGSFPFERSAQSPASRTSAAASAASPAAMPAAARAVPTDRFARRGAGLPEPPTPHGARSSLREDGRRGAMGSPALSVRGGSELGMCPQPVCWLRAASGQCEPVTGLTGGGGSGGRRVGFCRRSVEVDQTLWPGGAETPSMRAGDVAILILDFWLFQRFPPEKPGGSSFGSENPAGLSKSLPTGSQRRNCR